jgi:hypothetical protein
MLFRLIGDLDDAMAALFDDSENMQASNAAATSISFIRRIVDELDSEFMRLRGLTALADAHRAQRERNGHNRRVS